MRHLLENHRWGLVKDQLELQIQARYGYAFKGQLRDKLAHLLAGRLWGRLENYLEPLLATQVEKLL